ncbi:MAG: hypothetical protein K8R02_00585 [Anaerohalosphaeraceae bacterium]|nr:hypothetical protein [Anaerohalosphaeraceae bacterium]
MTKSIPATYVARLLYDGKMINNLQVPAGQDPFDFAQGRLCGLIMLRPFGTLFDSAKTNRNWLI